MNISSTDTRDAPVTPALSVIVVATAKTTLGECLAALDTQTGVSPIETLVVFDVEGPCAPAVARARHEYPGVRWIQAAPGATVPQMRSHGIRSSSGRIVGLLESDCLVEPGWAAAVLSAHQTSDVAIGGAVEPAPYRSALDWAVYFCEYGRFMLPLRPKANLALALASNNVTYKRAPALEAAATHAGGFYDVAIHSGWQAAGLPMRVDERVVVRNVNSWSLAHVTSVPYHHGRTFAAQRFPNRLARRGIFALLATSLPAVKTARVIIDTVAKGRFRNRLVQSLPWIILFMTSWSFGEMVGYLLGPGQSAARWR